MTVSEIDALRERLRNRPRSLQYTHITEATGLSRMWLQDFANPKGRKPHKSFCKKLADFFDSLEVSA